MSDRKAEILKERYESYLYECRDEISERMQPLSYEEFCSFFGITDETTADDLRYIFWD